MTRVNAIDRVLKAAVFAAAMSAALPPCAAAAPDGTGTWKWNFDGFLDDVAIWRRPLEMHEVKRIYDSGRKGQQLKDIAPVN